MQIMNIKVCKIMEVMADVYKRQEPTLLKMLLVMDGFNYYRNIFKPHLTNLHLRTKNFTFFANVLQLKQNRLYCNISNPL